MVRVIIVTGASRGIGEATVAKLCAAPDVIVLGVARAEKTLQQLKERHGSKFDYLVGDVTEERVVQAVLDKVSREYGRLDAIIANAGVSRFERIATADLEQWKHTFRVNLFSVVDLVSKALPLLRKSQGSVIVVSSGLSKVGYRASASYAASKIALNHFTRILAAEEPDIRAVAVAPGVVRTDMTVQSLNAADDAAGAEDNFLKEMLKQGRVVLPDAPGAVLAALAVKGIPQELNGKFVQFDSQKLGAYAKL
ncbi:AaceriABR246Wp [[Ashbya] aceris (nom. inval.)]|nr:AaceriABR246Wp [[Ashbya] aceris (nom. inval.)]